MELIDYLKKSSLTTLLARFPHSHLIAAGTLSLGLFAVSLFPSDTAEASRHIDQLPLPFQAEQDNATPSPSSADQEKTNTAEPTGWTTQTLSIQNGDTLSSLFKRAGLSQKAMMNFLAATENKALFSQLRPGKKVRFSLNQDKQIEELRYIHSELESRIYTRAGDNYLFSIEELQPDIKVAARTGIIKSSLYMAGTDAGMDDKLIMELADIYGWDIDFALDIRKGDSFRVLYEEHFLNGKKLRNGPILSAEFINQGQTFAAVRYVHKDGHAQYYTPEGRSMQKAFLRAPVDFRRISSNFNLKRLHPITKTIRPHRGIDYAAKVGTPVWSSGDGKVLKSGYSKYNGNYIVIQHGGGIQTKYLHLNKRMVKTGQRVRQKQIIGSVGTTGLSSGPHLHYEFLLNGTHRNPRTIVQKLPKAESIPNDLKPEFLRRSAMLMAQLDSEASTLYAFNGKTTSSDSL